MNGNTDELPLTKVIALTGGRHDPPSRFRLRQFIESLRTFNINVSEHYPLVNKYITKRVLPLALLIRLPGILASRTADVTWLERELVPNRKTLELSAGPRRIFDVDDAIWLNASRFSEEIARRSHAVIAGNDFIADYYSRLGVRVYTIPTSIDTSLWRPTDNKRNGSWTIGWTGSSSNLKYLELIEEPLAAFLREHSEARLLIVCDRKPELKSIPAGSWRFVSWHPESEVGSVQAMDVGLMPLANDEWAQGKCALKMIMYLAAGVPAVVSPVGVAGKMLEHGEVALAARTADEWFSALGRLYDDSQLVINLKKHGRRLVEDQYSVTVNAPKIAAVIREVSSGRS
ncbi:MAG TPA: glycosyltransferase family 4 protein [Pyrinomonadaceae bacterium]|nr:glycosyltransferase family 4 protein [Pyrinomonadaceae bacterium]